MLSSGDLLPEHQQNGLWKTFGFATGSPRKPQRVSRFGLSFPIQDPVANPCAFQWGPAIRTPANMSMENVWICDWIAPPANLLVADEGGCFCSPRSARKRLNPCTSGGRLCALGRCRAYRGKRLDSRLDLESGNSCQIWKLVDISGFGD